MPRPCPTPDTAAPPTPRAYSDGTQSAHHREGSLISSAKASTIGLSPTYRTAGMPALREKQRQVSCLDRALPLTPRLRPRRRRIRAGRSPHIREDSLVSPAKVSTIRQSRTYRTLSFRLPRLVPLSRARPTWLPCGRPGSVLLHCRLQDGKVRTIHVTVDSKIKGV